MTVSDIKFFEEYKKTEAILSDEFACSQGMTAYIEEMEKTPAYIQRQIPDWNTEYKRLKRLRYIRNKIAHESFDGGAAQAADLSALSAFHKSLISRTDPLCRAAALKKRSLKTAETAYNNVGRASISAASAAHIKSKKRVPAAQTKQKRRKTKKSVRKNRYILYAVQFAAALLIVAAVIFFCFSLNIFYT